MFDTHCHLNFSRFGTSLPDVISRARDKGIEHIIVPGTDIATSRKAVEIAATYEGVYAAAGVHPHHALGENNLHELEELLQHPRVVAVGEVGLDKHEYKSTKYENYQVDEVFIEKQKTLLKLQLDLAVKYKKTVILHNREAVTEILDILASNESLLSASPIVFHCCEADDQLLAFAKNHNIFIGVDGDVTYNREKQEFVKKIPLSLLVLETDAPYLLPEPLRSQKKFPNEPANIPVILSFIARLINRSESELKEITSGNAKKLFSLSG